MDPAEPEELRPIFDKPGPFWDAKSDSEFDPQQVEVLERAFTASDYAEAEELLVRHPTLAHHRRIIPLVYNAALIPKDGQFFSDLIQDRYRERRAVREWAMGDAQIGRLIAIALQRGLSPCAAERSNGASMRSSGPQPIARLPSRFRRTRSGASAFRRGSCSAFVTAVAAFRPSIPRATMIAS